MGIRRLHTLTPFNSTNYTPILFLFPFQKIIILFSIRETGRLCPAQDTQSHTHTHTTQQHPYTEAHVSVGMGYGVWGVGCGVWGIRGRHTHPIYLNKFFHITKHLFFSFFFPIFIFFQFHIQILQYFYSRNGMILSCPHTPHPTHTYRHHTSTVIFTAVGMYYIYIHPVQ